MLWKSSSRLVAGIALAVLLICPRAEAQAQGKPASPAPVIVIVDTQRVISESKAAKAIQAQIDQQSQIYSKEISKQEDDLQKLRADLERQRTILSPEAFNDKTKEFQQRYEELDRNVQGKRQALQQSFAEAMSKVEQMMLQVVGEIGQQRGANLVLEKRAVVFQADGFDISVEVLSRVDQRLPQVAVNLPKPGDAPAASAPRTTARPPAAVPPPKK